MIKILKFSRPYFAKYKGMLALHIVLFIILKLTEIVIPYISGSFIDELSTAKDTLFIKNYGIAFAVIALIEIFVGYITEHVYNTVQMKTGEAMEEAAIKHIHNLSPSYIYGKDTAFLSHRINNDANVVSMFCINGPERVLANAVIALVSLAMILGMDLVLGVSILALDVVYILLYQLLKKPIYKANYEVNEQVSEYFSKESEQLKNSGLVKIHGISESFSVRLRESCAKVVEKIQKELKISYCFTSSDSILKAVANVIIFVIGGAAVVSQKMTIGEFTIVMSYFMMSFNAAQFFFTFGEGVQEVRACQDRLQEIFDVPKQTNGAAELKSVDRIECDNLSFGYGGNNVLSGLSADFRKGNIYSLVGDNGSGKSTLISLILGLYIDEFKGRIAYNGTPISELDMCGIRNRLVGVSEQEPTLLPETLRFNLTLEEGKEIDQREFETLCEILDLKALLKSLPSGLDTVINENSSNLSGGEKQKLSILRALLKKPEVLVLDEPTSALDKASRQSLCAYLKSISENTIIIISTHDKELLDISDAVIQIENEKKAAKV